MFDLCPADALLAVGPWQTLMKKASDMRRLDPTELMINLLLYLQEVPVDQHRLGSHFYPEDPKKKKNAQKIDL